MTNSYLSEQNNPYDDDPLNNALRQVAGFGTEIGTGILTDYGTAPLITPPVLAATGGLSAAAYGVINFGSGYASNVAAQKIRGDNFSYGEAIAAGLFQMIPFGSTGKGVKGLAGAGLQGAVTAGGETTVRTAIDEQRLPTGGEFGTATTIGTVFGTGFKGSVDFLGSLSSKYSGKSATEIDSLITNEDKSRLEELLKNADSDEAKKIAKGIREGDIGFTDADGLIDEIVDGATYEQLINTKLQPFQGLEEGGIGKKRRGAEYLKKRILKQFPVKGADPIDAEDTVKFIDKFANRLDDVSISVTNKIGSQGRYNFATNLIQIRQKTIDEGELTDTMIHELWHSLSRYLPKKDLDKLTKDFQVEKLDYLTNLNAQAKSKDTDIRVRANAELYEFKKGTRYTAQNYRYKDIDEFFAENLKDISLERLDDDLELAPSGTWKRITQEVSLFIRDLFVSLKAKLGGPQSQRIYNDFLKNKNVVKQRKGPLDSPEFDEAIEGSIEGMAGDIRQAKAESQKDLDFFHGTSAEAAESINRQGFKSRHGSHGKGVYISTNEEKARTWAQRRRVSKDTIPYVYKGDIDESQFDLILDAQELGVSESTKQTRLARAEGKNVLIKNSKTWGTLAIINDDFATKTFKGPEVIFSPESGYSIKDLPRFNDDDVYRRPSKPIDPNINKRLRGPRQEDIDLPDRFLRSEIETNPRYPTSIPDEFAIAEADNILLPELKRRLDYLASRIRGKDDKKALRIQYLSALRHQFRITQNIVNTTQTIQDAVLNQTDFSDDLLEDLAKSYFDILDLVTPTKIIGSEAAGTLRASQLIQQPGTKRIPIDEQIRKGVGGGETPSQRVAADKAGRKNTRQLVEEAQTEAAEKALIPTEDEIFEALIRARDTGDIEGLVKLSMQVKAMNGDAKKIGKLFEGMTLGDRALRGLKVTNEIFINSILSAPETHIVNVVGSAFNVALGPVDLFLGSPITDTVAKGRAINELVGMITSTKESFKMASKAFYLDKNILDPARMFGQDASDRYAFRMEGDSPLASVINTLGTYVVRMPGRFMMAGDEFVKNIAFRSHLLGKFSEQATLEGLQGQEFKRYVKKNFDQVIDIVNKESVEPGTKKNILDAYVESLDYAADRTFTQELGHGFGKEGVGAGTTKKLASILKSSGLKPIVPFVTTPVNIGKSVLRRTGFQIPGAGEKYNLTLGKILKEHNDRLYSSDLSTSQRAQGEAITGGLIWASLITLAVQGNDPEAEIALIGGGHHNKYKRQNALRTGELPYSIRKIKRDEEGEIVRTEDGLPVYRYYDVLDRLEPIASMLMIAGDWAQMSHHMEADDEQEAAKALRVLMQRNFSNKYMLQNIGELFEIIDDPANFDRWMRIPSKYIGSVIGYPSSMLASYKRAKGEEWTNTSIGKTYTGRFAKKKFEIQSGDLTKQEIREDGTLRDTPETPFVGNALDTLGIFIMRELADKYPGYSADLEPMVSPTTGKVIERPSGLGTNWFMPLKYGESKGNVIDNFIARAGAQLTPPDSVIMQDDTGDGIKLDTKEYNKLKNLIPFIKIGGKRFPDRLLELYKKPQIQDMLYIIENGAEDSPDKQADLKLKKRQAKILRAEITSLYNAYADAAERHYIENMLDPEIRQAREEEQKRSINQLIRNLNF